MLVALASLLFSIFEKLLAVAIPFARHSKTLICDEREVLEGKDGALTFGNSKYLSVNPKIIRKGEIVALAHYKTLSPGNNPKSCLVSTTHSENTLTRKVCKLVVIFSSVNSKRVFYRAIEAWSHVSGFCESQVFAWWERLFIPRWCTGVSRSILWGIYSRLRYCEENER